MQANNFESDTGRKIFSMRLTLKVLMKTARNYVHREEKNETSLTVNTLHLYRESEKTTNSVERMNFSLWLF